MSRRGALAIDDCNRCKMTTNQAQRQSLGCGYEPRTDRVRLAVWQPPSGKNGYTGDALTVCAGFTANLPQVIETAMARVHWSKGNLQMKDAPEELLDCIVILEGQCNQLQSWLTTPAKDGGGMQDG